MDFKVSVIIPVFNCENFVEKSVMSAINCEEVGEVIIVDDGSTDKSYSICKKIALKSKKIKLFTHPNKNNKGPSASRNLGILNSRFPFISFLDADDWYQSYRFVKDRFIFNSNDNIDAAYSCTVLDENSGKSQKIYGVTFDPKRLWGNDISPIDFYEMVIEKRIVLFDTNGVTIKKDFLLKHKLFDERLFLHQDTELWHRLMRSGNFVASEIQNPVAVVRRHPNNRILKRSYSSHIKMMAVLIDNININNLFRFEINYFYRKILRELTSRFYFQFIRRFVYYFLFFIFFLCKVQFLKIILKVYNAN